MGRKAENLIAENPVLAMLYEDYLACRMTHFVPWRKPGSKAGEEKIVAVPWPMCLAHLPNAGGALDQDYTTMRIMSGFLKGDQRGTLRLMNKK